MRRLAKALRFDVPTISILAGEALERVTGLGPQDFANMGQAPGVPAVLRPSLTAAVPAEAELSRLSPQHLANGGWATRILQASGLAFTSAALARALDLVSEFGPQDSTTAAQAPAALAPRRELLLQATCREGWRQLPMPNSQGPANVSWRHTTLQLMGASLLSAAGESTAASVQELLPQELANSIRDFTSLESMGVAVTVCTSSAVSRRSTEFDCRGPANTLWSSTVLRILPGLQTAIVGKLREASAQDLSNRARRHAAASIKDETLFAVIADEFSHKRGQPVPQNAANSAREIATTSIKNKPLSAAIVVTCMEKVRELAARETANTLQSLGTAAQVDLPLCTASSSAALRTARQPDPQGLANVLRGLATALAPPSEEPSHRTFRSETHSRFKLSQQFTRASCLRPKRLSPSWLCMGLRELWRRSVTRIPLGQLGGSPLDAAARRAAWREAVSLLVSAVHARQQPLCSRKSVGKLLGACAAHWPISLSLLTLADRSKLTLDLRAFCAVAQAATASRAWRRALEQLQEAFCLFEPDDAAVGLAAAAGAHGPWQLAFVILADARRRHLLNFASYGSVIGGLAQSSSWRHVLVVLDEMRKNGLSPNVATYSAALKALQSAAQWSCALQLFRASRSEVIPDAILWTSAISAVQEGGDHWALASWILGEARGCRLQVNMHMCSAAMSAMEKSSEWQHALLLFATVCRSQMRPDTIACNAALSTCGQGSRWEIAWCRGLHSHLLETFTAGHFGMNAAAQAFAKAFSWRRCLLLMAALTQQRGGVREAAACAAQEVHLQLPVLPPAPGKRRALQAALRQRLGLQPLDQAAPSIDNMAVPEARSLLAEFHQTASPHIS
ncbi:EMB2076, partial [Symbiodinium sp. CCMP2456]